MKETRTRQATPPSPLPLAAQVTFPEFFRHHWRWARTPLESDLAADKRRKRLREVARPNIGIQTAGPGGVVLEEGPEGSGSDGGGSGGGSGSTSGAGALPVPPLPTPPASVLSSASTLSPAGTVASVRPHLSAAKKSEAWGEWQGGGGESQRSSADIPRLLTELPPPNIPSHHHRHHHYPLDHHHHAVTVVLSAGATKLALAPPDDNAMMQQVGRGREVRVPAPATFAHSVSHMSPCPQANAEKDVATAIIAWVYILLSMLCAFVAAGASGSRHSGTTGLVYWVIGWFPYYLGMGFAVVLCLGVMAVAVVRLVHLVIHLPCWQNTLRGALWRVCPRCFFSRRSMGGKGWAGGADINRDGMVSPDDDDADYTDATHNPDGGCCSALRLLTRYPILHDDEEKSQHAVAGEAAWKKGGWGGCAGRCCTPLWCVEWG